MRYVLATLAVLGACSLDPSDKPICLEDNDCNYFELDGHYESYGHCVTNACIVNVDPIGVPDVLYARPGVTRVVADVTANDNDPDDVELEIHDAEDLESSTFNGNEGIEVIDDHTVEITVPAVLPASFRYQVVDTTFARQYSAPEPEWTAITVARLPDELVVAVARDTPTSLAATFLSIPGATADTVELITPPQLGSTSGPGPDAIYTPPTGLCGDDHATYRIRAANGDFEVSVRFAVGLVLASRQDRMAFGTPRTFEPLADEAPGLTLTGASATAGVAVQVEGNAIVVDPPVDTTGTYEVTYTAVDARDCSGTGTMTLAVEFPTAVIVGEGITGDSFDPSPSANGRFIAFTSADSTLIAGDTNHAADVFVLDIDTGEIDRVSVATDGTQANGSSGSASISADGRWVSFVSQANNLAAADTSGVDDVYLHDRNTGATSLISVSVDNTGSDQPSVTPQVSDDGMRVVFASTATRLVGDDSNNVLDVFLRDVATSTTQRVSLTSSGSQAPFAASIRPRVSGDGRFVALISSSALTGNGSSGAFLVDTLGGSISWLASAIKTIDVDDAGRFVALGTTTEVTIVDRTVDVIVAQHEGEFPSLSANGRHGTFAGTIFNTSHVFGLHGQLADDVLVDPSGAATSAVPLRRPEVSADGRWVVFASNSWPDHAGQFVIVRVWNRGYQP